MRRTVLLTTAAGAALLLGVTPSLAGQPDHGLLLAQAPGNNLGTPPMQPAPGGSVAAGPGAPTSATPAAPGSGAPNVGRGPPPPGSATPLPGGGVTGSSQLGPTGAIVPGAQGAEPGTGGSQSSSTP